MTAMSIAALEILEQSEMPGQYARAIAKAIESTVEFRRDDLATKADLTELRLATKADIAELRLETKADIAELKSELKTDIGNVRAEMGKMKGDLMQWVLATALGLLAAQIGATYFLVIHLR